MDLMSFGIGFAVGFVVGMVYCLLKYKEVIKPYINGGVANGKKQQESEISNDEEA